MHTIDVLLHHIAGRVNICVKLVLPTFIEANIYFDTDFLDLRLIMMRIVCLTAPFEAPTYLALATNSFTILTKSNLFVQN